MDWQRRFAEMVREATTTGVSLEPIVPDPQPLLIVVRSEYVLSNEQIGNLTAFFDYLKSTFPKLREIPFVICQPGLSIEAVIDPRFKEPTSNGASSN